RRTAGNLARAARWVSPGTGGDLSRGERDGPVYGGTPRVLSRDSRIPSPRPVHWRPASPRPRRSTRGVVVPVRVGLVRPTERVGRPLAADTGVRAGPAV